MNTLQETAYRWLDMGFATLPIQFMRKEPDARALLRAGLSEPDETGRLKGCWLPLQDRLPTSREIECMFVSSLVNLGVITGHQGLVVLDFDDWATFLNWWKDYPIETYMVRSARGIHLYFQVDEPTAGRKGIGLDVKARGGYVLGVPSIHPTRALYEVMLDRPITRLPSIEPLLPAELFPQPDQVPAVVTQYQGAAPAPVANGLDPWATIMAMGNSLAGRDLIGEIRQQVSILDYLSGAERSSADGRWYLAKCPFHTDSHPSFWIDTHRQVCGCHAGCEGGRPFDVINLVARLKGLSNRDAIFLLAKVL